VWKKRSRTGGMWCASNVSRRLFSWPSKEGQRGQVGGSVEKGKRKNKKQEIARTEATRKGLEGGIRRTIKDEVSDSGKIRKEVTYKRKRGSTADLVKERGDGKVRLDS